MAISLTMAETWRIAWDMLALVVAGVLIVCGVSCGVWLLSRIWP